MSLIEQTKQAEPLDIEATIADLRDRTTKELADKYNSFNMILLGPLGVGKTSILETARRPVIVHSFDPGGCNLRNFMPLIESGDIIADVAYETEDNKNPSAYMKWEMEFERLKNAGVFNNIGTFCIDSFTTFITAMKNEICKRKGRPNSIPQIQDYMEMGINIVNIIKLCTALPCDFILTGHLTLEKDEVSGRFLARFKSFPSLQIDVPLLFDEIYVMQAEETREGVERRLITQSTGKYEARTRIGARLFDVYEQADIQYLLKKAGRIQ